MLFRSGVWLAESYSPQTGGGSSYYDVLISAIDAHAFRAVDVVFVALQDAPPGICKEVVVLPRFAAWVNWMFKKVATLFPERIAREIRCSGEACAIQYLRARAVDLIFYPIQDRVFLTELPYVASHWDTGPLSTYGFPELVNGGVLEDRTQAWERFLLKALLVLCESEAGRKETIRYCGINPDRIKVVPLVAGQSGKIAGSENEERVALERFHLQPGRYFFYPAQFWAHKNHYGLVAAFQMVVRDVPDLKLVLTGADKGNSAYIERCVSDFELDESVVFAGFVSVPTIAALYRHAAALVMPSYLGPTNMPLIEALQHHCPVVCSDLEGHREIMSTAALYFRPSDHAEMAARMQQALAPAQRAALIEAGKRRLHDTPFTITHAVQSLEQALGDLVPIRLCWS